MPGRAAATTCAAWTARRQAAARPHGRLAERCEHAPTSWPENERLRALLDLRPALQVRSLAAEVMYEAADPYSRKVFIDRGQPAGRGARRAGHQRGRRAGPGDACCTR
jgi:rod shape-determining protein MreC